MRKYGLVLSILLIAMLLLPSSIVMAASVTTMDADGSNGKLTISGTTTEDCLAVAILVYDEAGINLVYIETTGVENSAYKSTINLANGTYTVKAGDYDGENGLITKKVTVTGSETTPAADTESPAVTTTATTATTTATTAGLTAPKTEDSKMIWVWMFIMSVSGLSVIAVEKRRGSRL